MEVQDIKNKLIAAGCVNDNYYLDLYCKLITENLKTLKIKNKTQQHHILPRYYYKSKNMIVDDSRNNLVNLAFRDHILAHYYLAECSSEEFRYKNIYAIIRMSKSYKGILEILDHLDDAEKLYFDYQEYNRKKHLGKKHQTSQQTKNKISASNRKTFAINKYKHIFKDDEEKEIPESELPQYLNAGWMLGRAPHSHKALSEGYNYASKGMLGKEQSQYQKECASKAQLGKQKSQEARKHMSESKKLNNYVCLKHRVNKNTIRVKKENKEKYLAQDYILCAS